MTEGKETQFALENFLLIRLGPVLLLVAFAIILFKYAPFYWPLITIALMGYALVCYWKKKGLVFSVISLVFISIIMVRSGEEILWMTLLPLSIALSWTLIFLNLKTVVHHEKLIATQVDLQELKEKEQLSALHAKHFETMHLLEQMQYKYATLREQFNEKSMILNDARKELFKTGNELLALQKAWEEKKLEPSEEEKLLIKELYEAQEESLVLETCLLELQDIVSLLLIPKKKSSPKSKKKLPLKLDDLPDLLQR